MAAHRSIAGSALVFVACISGLSLFGCDALIKKIKGEGGENGDTTTSSGDAPKGKATSGCTIPDAVTADVTVKKDCNVDLKSSVYVRGGATLKIEQGAKIKVEQGNFIWIEDGKLVAKGTEKDPIVFTSANKTQAEGDWVGIGFEGKTQAGTEIDWVHIEYAGSASSNGHGAIEVKDQSSAKRVSITNTTITHSAQSAVVNLSEKGGFSKFEHNTFKKNKSSLEAHTRVLGSVGAGNVFTDPLITTGNVEENTTWPAFDAPVIVKNEFEIGGDKSPASLTIAPKTILKMNPGSYISVGTRNGGSLIANNVSFTSENGTPQPGDWVGIFIYARASTVQLDGALIDYAGRDASGGRAAITFYDGPAKNARGTKITNVTFKHTANFAMSSPDHDCSPFTAGNKVDGVPFCRPE